MLTYYSKKYELKAEDFPNAYRANHCSISLPLFHGMTEGEQQYVIKILKENVCIMCGIAGLINFDDTSIKVVLERMTHAIAHRGPDGQGHWIEGNVGIGHRRLSIIDLSLCQQPMLSSNHRYVLSYTEKSTTINRSH